MKVSEAAGDIIEKLLGFADSPERPQKLLLHLRRSGWSSVFLSAFIGFWRALEDSQIAELYEDYEDVPAVDYGKLWQLEGAQVLAISCTPHEGGSTSVTMLLDRGTLEFYALDPKEPHSESGLRWTPAS